MLHGKFVGVKESVSVFTVEKKFHFEFPDHAVLKATSLGLYFAEINGRRVGDCYLTPGWTSYKKTLQVQEYDVTSLLRRGENTIAFTVGEGWYCGSLNGDRRSKIYGDKTAVCADLIFADRTISTDESWAARESFIRESGIYDGETQDFIAPLKPLAVCEVPFDQSVLVGQICEPVREIERLAVKEVIITPNGETVYDFGQNIAGVVEIETPKDFDGTLTLQFAEILVNGNFYNENFRTAKATDIFTVKGAKTMVPEFTFHGFRYMKLSGGKLPKGNITAIVRHTDMKRTGHVRTNNARFNRLMENVVWGQRGNFVDIPTDCPQRDERVGWTGDINAFCRTAAYNYDVRAFLKKWLIDLRNDQSESGEIPFVAPDCIFEKHTDAMWCDAITMVPWTLYEMYGDEDFLKDNFEAMKKFVSARERTMQNGLIVRGHEFGDWLALDRDPFTKDELTGRTDVYFLTNVFHVHSLKIVRDTAKRLGDTEAEGIYNEKYQTQLRRVREEYFTTTGRLVYDTVTAQTVALHFGIVPQEFRPSLAQALNENVKKHDYKMVTGFVGSPFVLFALADNGYFETAEKVLFQNEFPGWLYEVDMGATTVWERWNSLLPGGMPNPDGMNSYNHYAYGSVMEFVYRRIAGIEPTAAGFAKIKIAPVPCKELNSFQAEYESVNGKIFSGYERQNGKITYRIEVPANVQTEIVLPDEKPITVKGGKLVFERAQKENGKDR